LVDGGAAEKRDYFIYVFNETNQSVSEEIDDRGKYVFSWTSGIFSESIRERVLMIIIIRSDAHFVGNTQMFVWKCSYFLIDCKYNLK
jgi:hypothetical protein